VASAPISTLITDRNTDGIDHPVGNIMLQPEQALKLVELSTCIGVEGFCDCDGETHLLMPVAIDKLTDTLAWVISESNDPAEMYSLVGQKLFTKTKMYAETTDQPTN